MGADRGIGSRIFTGGGTSGDSWRQPVRLRDNISTSKPTGSVTIDGITPISNGDRVLFSNLTGSEAPDNNKVFRAVVSGGSVTGWLLDYDGQPNGSPQDGNIIYIKEGTSFGDKIFKWTGSNWSEVGGGGGGGITQLTTDVLAGPGSGVQIATIANNAVNDQKIRLPNNTWLRARNSSDTSDIELLGVNTSNLRIFRGSFYPSLNNSFELGSGTSRWMNVTSTTFTGRNYNVANNTYSGTQGGLGEYTTPSGGLAVVVRALSPAGADGFNAGIITENNSNDDSFNTGNIHIESGNKFNGTGHSGAIIIRSGLTHSGEPGSINLLTGGSLFGNYTGGILIATGDADYSNPSLVSTGGISLSTGASYLTGNSGNIDLETGIAAGTRGNIRFRDGSEGTVGHVWTSIGPYGEGTWAPVGGGITQLTTDVLAGPGSGVQIATIANNAVNDQKIRLPNNTWLRARNSSNTSDIELLGVNTSDLRVFRGSFYPSLNDSFELGSGTSRWMNVTSTTFTGRNYNVANNTYSGTQGGLGEYTTPSSATAVVVRGLSPAGADGFNAGVITENNSNANSFKTGNIYIETGRKTSGTGNSGNIFMSTGFSQGGNSGTIDIETGSSLNGTFTGSVFIHTGGGASNPSLLGTGKIYLFTGGATTAGNSGNIELETGLAVGTRGKIKFIDGSEGTVGHVWTSTDTDGSGAWAPMGGGITELTTDVLAGPGSGVQIATIANNAVNDQKIRLPNNTWLRARDSSDTSDIELLGVNTSDLRVFRGSFYPSLNDSFELGSGTSRWMNVTSTTFTGRNYDVANNTYSGIQGGLGEYALPSFWPHSVDAVVVRALSPAGADGFNAGIITENNSNDDSFQTGNIYIESGNKLEGPGNSGNIYVKSGFSHSGISGNIDIQTGTSLLGDYTGNIFIVTGGVSSNPNILRTGGIYLITGGTTTTGDSGHIELETGVAVNNRGKIRFRDGSEGTVGHVWTSTDTDGSGAWAPMGGGITELTTDVLAGPGSGVQIATIANNAVNDQKIRLPNNTWLRARDSSDTSDIELLGVNTSDLRVFRGSFYPSLNDSFELGSGTSRWMNVTSTTFTGRNYDVANNTYSGIQGGLGEYALPSTWPSSVNAVVVRALTPTGADGFSAGIITEDNSNDDSFKTGNIHIETGNKLAGTGNSGNIYFKSGFSNNGDSGLINIETGVSLNGSYTGHIMLVTGNADVSNPNMVITGGIYLITGGTTTTGDSGHIQLETGVAVGTRGNIRFRDGSEGPVGRVWTSIDAEGAGTWTPVENLGLLSWAKYTIDFDGPIAAPAYVNDIELFSLPEKGVIHAVVVKHTISFIGGSSTFYNISVGITGNLTKYAPDFDVSQPTGPNVGQTTSVVDFESTTGPTSIRVRASSDDTLDSITQGQVEIWVLTSVLP